MQTFEVTLRDDLYEQVKQRADQTNRDIVTEVIAAVEVLLATDGRFVGLPLDLAEELAQLPFLDNAHL